MDAKILNAKISNVVSSLMPQHRCNTTLLTINPPMFTLLSLECLCFLHPKRRVGRPQIPY